MLTLLKVFGPSPFAPLQIHMEKVFKCVQKVQELFKALKQQNWSSLESIAAEISHLEHEADLAKNNIRNHLTKGLFLLVDRADLLQILSLQDDIADKAEDIGVLLSLRPLTVPALFEKEFDIFLAKNWECFDKAYRVMQELNELLESSFGGKEAEKVKAMVEGVAFSEHEADLIQKELLKKLFNCDDLSPAVFNLWLKIFHEVSALSNLSETLVNRIRMLLEVK